MRESHPYDDGYWARVDGKPRPRGGGQRRQGWDDANTELSFEEWRQRHSDVDVDVEDYAKPSSFKRGQFVRYIGTGALSMQCGDLAAVDRKAGTGKIAFVSGPVATLRLDDMSHSTLLMGWGW